MKRILVTGGGGFLGQNIKKQFEYQKSIQQIKHPHFDVVFPNSEEMDILDYTEFDRFVFDYKPDTILHMAALAAGLKGNMKRPADFITLNTQMGLNIFEVARARGIKFVHTLGSVCAYGDETEVPFKEEDLFNHMPQSTNSYYGQSKRTLFMLGLSYREQYGIGGSHLIPVNLMGPFDHFDLENSHVVPALINKFVNAKENNSPFVNCWGTGMATREFLYSEDAAEIIVKAVLNDFNDPRCVNLGTGQDISIKDLSDLIASLINYTGEIIFTGEVGDGQKKRMLDVSRAESLLGWRAKTDLKTGLIKTIEWYKTNKGKS